MKYPKAKQPAPQELAPALHAKMLSCTPSSWRRWSLRTPCMQNAIWRASGRVAGAVHAKCYLACTSGRAAGFAGACAAPCMQNAIRHAPVAEQLAPQELVLRPACKMLSGVPRPSSGRRRNSNRSCVLKCCSARKVPSGVPVSEYPAPQGDVTDADSVDTHSIANVVVRRFVVNKVNQFDTWPATTIHDKQ